MTTYSMTPISNGTRLRNDHATVLTATITQFNKGEVLTGSELWEAPADGNEVKKGDKWLKVTHKNGVALAEPGWTAYIHKGVPVCNNFKEVETTPPPAPMFPESFVLTDPSGEKAEYVFVRVITE